jgi:predicted secreted Zn-dependent protease
VALMIAQERQRLPNDNEAARQIVHEQLVKLGPAEWCARAKTPVEEMTATISDALRRDAAKKN